MSADKAVQAAKDQLNLVLSFFSRVESKSSVLLAINTGMLGFLAANAPPLRELSNWMAITATLTLLLSGASIAMLYRGAFPRLGGGQGSLIYFREIAGRTEHKFVEEFKAQSDEHYANELLAQAWRNAQILRAKFDHVKYAFTFVASAILPWLLTVALFAAHQSSAAPHR